MIPTYDASLTARPEGWARFLGVVRENFTGPNNRGIRHAIYTLADRGEHLLGLERTIALTAGGKASLRACDEALAAWDGRALRAASMPRGRYAAERN